MLSEGGTHGCAIIPKVLFSPKTHGLLMSLATGDHQVARLGKVDGFTQRVAAIRHAVKILAFHAAR